MHDPVTILAIETSCDETGIAVLQKSADKIKVLSDAVASQIDIHKKTGGIVPEIAAREHLAIIQPLIKNTIGESGVKPASLSAIAVTVGPGLMPALSVGVTAAQALSYAWDKPIVPIHHLEGHIYSALLASGSNTQFPISSLQSSNIFPAVALVVSGGHTMLVKMDHHLQYKILGSTRDDAVGEAFDKIARLLGLSYPGGPAISQAAERGNPAAFNFTRPMLRSGDLDFSFSGLKTEVLYKVREIEKNHSLSSVVSDISASFQMAAVDSLIAKTRKALTQTRAQLLLLAGGVAANNLLRRQMQNLADEHRMPLHIAPLPLCGDNGTMIGLAAIIAHQKNRLASWRDIDAQARISLEDFSRDKFATRL